MYIYFKPSSGDTSDTASNTANGAANGAMNAFPAETPIGMAYVPYQQWEAPYAENIALEKGTMFPSLDLPFCGKEVSGK